MEVMTTLPRSRPLTRADLDTMPDDGHRYELVDGTLIVSPAPRVPHQRTLGNLHLLLRGACPDDLEVLIAPVDVALADDTVLQPDLLVARRVDLTDRDLPMAPVLAVEVLSPSTRRFDLLLKRSRFESAGCPSYWVVDPDEPSLTAWDLDGGRYGDPVIVVADQRYDATRPFPVSVVPVELVSDKRH